VQYFYVIKNIGHHACLREKEHLFRYRAYFEGNLSRFVRARTHVRAQMTQIACAVGMRNAILRNHLKDVRANCFCARIILRTQINTPRHA